MLVELPILSPDELYTRFDGEEVLLLCQHLPVSGYSKLNKGERVSLLAGFFSLHVAQKGAKKPSPAKVAKQGVQSSGQLVNVWGKQAMLTSVPLQLPMPPLWRSNYPLYTRPSKE